MIATESLRGSRLLVVVMAVALAASSLVVNHSGAKAVTGAITEYPITTAAARPTLITTGSDGNLWFVEEGANKVAKITTAGAFTEFDAPTSGSPAVITVGPDGNLWFTDETANTVDKATTAGAIVEYP